ncbi:MAG: glycosyltransferase family 2 protein [Candidatus Erginobacter occultus]|nr:glycosyltransferase family 2 protein [Candidatus Erginobacter occultus]
MESPDFSVVIPVFNEEENIAPLCRELRETLNRWGRAYEVLIVDDGSTDSTLDKLRQAKAVFPSLRVIRNPRRFGQSAALAAGFRFARARVLVTMDGDLQIDPEDILRLLETAGEYRAAVGRRQRRRDPAPKHFQAKLANRIRSLVLQDRFADIGCPLRVFPRADLERIQLFDGFHRFLPVLLAAAGRTVLQVPVNHRPRRRGRSKYGGLNRIFRTTADLFGVNWMLRRRIEAAGEEVE